MAIPCEECKSMRWRVKRSPENREWATKRVSTHRWRGSHPPGCDRADTLHAHASITASEGESLFFAQDNQSTLKTALPLFFHEPSLACWNRRRVETAEAGHSCVEQRSLLASRERNIFFTACWPDIGQVFRLRLDARAVHAGLHGPEPSWQRVSGRAMGVQALLAATRDRGRTGAAKII